LTSGPPIIGSQREVADFPNRRFASALDEIGLEEGKNLLVLLGDGRRHCTCLCRSVGIHGLGGAVIPWSDDQSRGRFVGHEPAESAVSGPRVEPAGPELHRNGGPVDLVRQQGWADGREGDRRIAIPGGAVVDEHEPIGQPGNIEVGRVFGHGCSQQCLVALNRLDAPGHHSGGIAVFAGPHARIIAIQRIDDPSPGVEQDLVGYAARKDAVAIGIEIAEPGNCGPKGIATMNRRQFSRIAEIG